MIPAYNKRGALLSIRDWNPWHVKVRLLFPEEDTTMPYSGFEPEPPRLQAEVHIHYTGREPEMRFFCNLEYKIFLKSTISDFPSFRKIIRTAQVPLISHVTPPTTTEISWPVAKSPRVAEQRDVNIQSINQPTATVILVLLTDRKFFKQFL
ncbi:uncharacterized protein TNCV_3397001 [Trichonephila clavipes]|nr:uncharacterized protein TNCV_3397001 [Trichonephila clavipes]